LQPIAEKWVAILLQPTRGNSRLRTAARPRPHKGSPAHAPALRPGRLRHHRVAAHRPGPPLTSPSAPPTSHPRARFLAIHRRPVCRPPPLLPSPLIRRSLSAPKTLRAAFLPDCAPLSTGQTLSRPPETSRGRNLVNFSSPISVVFHGALGGLADRSQSCQVVVPPSTTIVATEVF
jgi:hypothetical protein